MATMSVPVRVVLLALGILCGGLMRPGAADDAGQDAAARLVLQLPVNGAQYNQELEQRIARLGPDALPALTRELRLGIRFKELNELLKANGSRRGAVASVLAKIPGEASTDLLVQSLADPPDSLGMTLETLAALERRPLTVAQLVRLLGSSDPAIVSAGIKHRDAQVSKPEIREALERLFEPDSAQAQFRNEYDVATLTADGLWDMRLTTGRALGRDLGPEIRERAVALLATLAGEAEHPTDPDRPVFIQNASPAELAICDGLNKLQKLGAPVRDLVADAARTAKGNPAKVLDMALVRLGDRDCIVKVARHLTDSDSPTIRYCAAVTLRLARDKSAMPALRTALRDPYQRADASCVRDKEVKIHPVRLIAADALIDLGADPRQVRADAAK